MPTSSMRAATVPFASFIIAAMPSSAIAAPIWLCRTEKALDDFGLELQGFERPCLDVACTLFSYVEREFQRDRVNTSIRAQTALHKHLGLRIDGRVLRRGRGFALNGSAFLVLVGFTLLLAMSFRLVVLDS